jgi:hypothetical protein
MCCNPANGRVEFEDVWLIKPSFITMDEMKACQLTRTIFPPHPKKKIIIIIIIIITIFVLEKNVVGHWPWMASIGYVDDTAWKHQCGATLITRKHFLTAGHCAMKE